MIRKIFSSELGKGASILFISMMVFNFLNFLFHFSMGRFLGPKDYGILAVLMSFIYIFNVPVEAIQNIITKYTSKFNAKKEEGKINYLMFKSMKKSFKIALFIFSLSILFAFFLSYYLSINFWLIVFTNIFIFSSFFVPIIRGVLQGKKEFVSLGLNMILESFFKLVFAISFVLFGFRVFGAMVGVLFGILASIIFGLNSNKKILYVKEEKAAFNAMYQKSVPYFFSILIILLIFNLDVILAKRFFPDEIAGQYAVLSILGKMFYFGTLAISKAMFPLTSETYEKKGDCKGLFVKSLLIVIGLSLIGILIYGLFPTWVVGILYGKQYLEIAPYLVYSALALSFLSLANLVLIYGLSTKGLKNYYYLSIFLVIEIIFLYMYHSSIKEYILAFMVSNIVMFIGSFFFLKR